MEQICIRGEAWVRLHDVCDILREVKEQKIFDRTEDVIFLISQLMFYDEVMEAETDEERDAARELPGDFIVYKDLGYRNPNGKRLIYFSEFADGEGKAVDSMDKAMCFEYESKAEEVAKMLGEEWNVVCVGYECGRITKRHMDAIYRILAEMDKDE